MKLKDMKISIKLACGFGLVGLIMLCLGVTAYYMFVKTDTNVKSVANYNIPSVKLATNIERNAFESILAEKNYIIYGKEEFTKQQDLFAGELNNILSDIDKLAQQFSDKELAKDCEEVKTLCNKFDTIFDDCAKKMIENNNQEQVMNNDARDVEQQARDFLAYTKTSSSEQRKALSIVNRINALALTARMKNNKFLNTKDDKTFTEMEKDISDLMVCYGELEKLNPDEKELKLINNARESTKIYLETAKQWRNEYRANQQSPKLAQLTNVFADNGNKVQTAVAEYLKAKEIQNETTVTQQEIVNDILSEVLYTRYNQKSYMQTREQRFWDRIENGLAKLNQLYTDLRKITIKEENIKRIDTAKTETDHYQIAANKWRENDNYIRSELFPILKKAGEDSIAIAQQTQEQAWKKAEGNNNNVISIVSQSKLIIMVSIVIAILLASLAALFIGNSITKPLAMVLDRLKDIAEGEGDLTKEIAADSNDEVGQVAKTFNKFLGKWRNIIREILDTSRRVAEGTNSINTAASEIFEGSEKLASSTQETATAVEQMNRNIQIVLKSIEDQTSSVTETTTSVEEMTRNVQKIFQNVESQASSVNESTAAVEQLVSSINQVATNADQVNIIANDVNQKAVDGNKAVKETVGGMKDIAASAEKINNIIGVITGIASQTNLLALNAAIEAARAGDAGKGFAVVADEVRNLAEQSAQAAKEITALIKDANSKAEKGLHLAEAVDVAITEMTQSIKQVTHLAEEVGQSTREQQKGANEISKSMENLNQVTQGVVGSLEEQSKGADEISRAMQNLAKISEEISASMNEQAAGTEQISKSVEEVSSIAEENSAGSKQSLNTTKDVSSQVQSLQDLLSGLKV